MDDLIKLFFFKQKRPKVAIETVGVAKRSKRGNTSKMPKLDSMKKNSASDDDIPPGHSSSEEEDTSEPEVVPALPTTSLARTGNEPESPTPEVSSK